jgi:hypothetical protein
METVSGYVSGILNLQLVAARIGPTPVLSMYSRRFNLSKYAILPLSKKRK